MKTSHLRLVVGNKDEANFDHKPVTKTRARVQSNTVEAPVKTFDYALMFDRAKAVFNFLLIAALFPFKAVAFLVNICIKTTVGFFKFLIGLILAVVGLGILFVFGNALFHMFLYPLFH
jgi:hypothetical protein